MTFPKLYIHRQLVCTQCFCLHKEQEEQRMKMMQDEVASNRMIHELKNGLLSHLISTYRCITDDAEFIRGLSTTNVSNSFFSLTVGHTVNMVTYFFPLISALVSHNISGYL